MIKEDRVTFEIAKLLKDKGFPQNTFEIDCNVCYKYNGKLCNNAKSISGVDREISYMAPTIQMVLKWLREEKGVAIIPVISSILDNKKFLWDIKIVVANTGDTYSQGWVYEKLETAYDAAIKHCLTNLI